MRSLPVSMLILAAIIIGGCENNARQNNDIAVPRREAYPRLQICDTVYATTPGLPLHIELNAGTTVEIDRRPDGVVWLSQKYPSYGITVFYTLLPGDSKSLEAALQRSLRRITDNIGGAPADRSEAESPNGFYNYLLRPRGLNPFPLQFISTDGNTWLLTASATYTNGHLPESADSVAPMLGALQRDIVHTLNTLAHAQQD